MSVDRGRSTATVALLVVGVLLALWAVRFVVGVLVGLAQLALLAAIGLGAAYAGYRLWRGWTAAGEAAEPTRRR